MWHSSDGGDWLKLLVRLVESSRILILCLPYFALPCTAVSMDRVAEAILWPQKKGYWIMTLLKLWFKANHHLYLDLICEGNKCVCFDKPVLVVFSFESKSEYQSHTPTGHQGPFYTYIWPTILGNLYIYNMDRTVANLYIYNHAGDNSSNILCCSKKSCVKNSIPQIEGIRNCEAFGNRLALGKGPAFQNKMSTFVKRCDRAFLHLLMWHYIRKTAICEEGSQPSLSTEALGVLVSDFSALSAVRSRFMLYRSHRSVVFNTARND